jgi:hypothetical protein
MRSTVTFAIAALALVGCFSETYELPLPDEREEFYVQFASYGRGADCFVGDEVLWEGLVGKDAPNKCEACQCGPAACALPLKVTAHASVCPGEDDAGTVEARRSWDGSCTARTMPIQSDAFAYVTFEPPALAPCVPVEAAPEPWRRPLGNVKACKLKPQSMSGVPSGAVTCYPPQANGECWKGYAFLRNFPIVIDTRACTPCSCGAPEGGKCAVKTTLYQDERCFDELGNTVISNSEPPICSRVDSAPLAAMRSGFTLSEPGTCTPSVSTIEGGKLVPVETHVVCCNR